MSANTAYNGEVFATASVANETGFANSSGYTLSGASVSGFRNPVLLQLYNRTSGVLIGNNNVTISAPHNISHDNSAQHNKICVNLWKQTRR
jgi:hypothetical protein